MPTLKLSKDSPLHKKLVAKLSSRIEMARQSHQNQHAKWAKAEELTLAYLPEQEVDAARRRGREGGEPAYTTIQIPYSYAVLMSAHTYWTSVFFARSPVHQFSGRHGEGEQQTQAVEALINYQVEVGGALAPYYIWLYDAGKYGCGILGSYWDVEKIHVGQLVEMETIPGSGKFSLYQSTMEMEGYRGNRVYNVSPYDFMHDPRVPLSRFQDGEFCVSRCRLGWHKIIQRKDAGYYNDNINHLNNHVTDKGATEGSSTLIRPDFSKTFLHDDENSKHPAGAVFYEVYISLIPDEWGLGTSKYPQKWCFSITEDMSLIVGASPLPYIHAKFPFDVLECEVEGYGVYNRGFLEILDPIQNTMDWLLNSHFYNVRAALNNQFIIDPSKIVVKDAKSAGPGFIWRLRPEAYGTDLRQMFMQVPVSDVTRTHLSDIQLMLSMGERTLGVNDQIMGMLGGTQRKTATEVRTTTGFGVNRQKTICEYMSASAFAPHAQKLLQSSQQFYDGQQKLRRVGDLALEAGEAFLNVTPDDIMGFFDFVPVDGTLPADRMAQANLWKEMLAGLGRMPPAIIMSYDWGRIFGWVATLAGLKNINQFKVQVLPPGQAPGQNVIPMRPPGAAVTPGNSASTAAGLNALGGEGGALPEGY